MAIHIAFLRGINLGKNRRVGGQQLRAAFEGAGFDRVSTFRASGNVAFDAAGEAGGLTGRVEAALAEELGFEVRVFLRTARQVRSIAAHQLFRSDPPRAATGKLQVALLPAAPGAAKKRNALALAGEDDLLAVRGSELYWLPSGRMVESDLDLKALEGLLGPWTMRTKGTIEQIAARHCD
jgi:uncharacterized protein (DUF1697 family)